MQFARRHILSIYGITVLLLVVMIGVGWPTNSGDLAMMLGYAAGVATDPMVIGVGLLLGAVLERWWAAILGCFVAAVFLHFVIVQIDELGIGGPPIGTILPRTFAFMCWASLSSLVRALVTARTRHTEAVEEGA